MTVNYNSYFDVRNNTLYLDNRSLPELAKKYGTPVIIYSKRKIQENVKKLQSAFNSDYTSIHFSIKSNYNPSILRILRGMGVGADAATLNEVQLSLRIGFEPGKIIASPNNLSRDDLVKISRLGVVMNFDDISQLEAVGNELPEVVSFRINPGIGRGEFKSITTGGKGSKFGMPPEAATKAYGLAKKAGAKRFGIHMMTGSNVLDATFFKLSSELFFDVAEKIAIENEIDFEFLDLGGGLGVPYGPKDEELDIGLVASHIMENFEKRRSLGLFRNSKLVLEPGRFIVANAGVLLSTVTDVKEYDELFVGTDVSMNSLLRVPLYGAVHPIIVANKVNDGRNTKTNLVGQVCENTDILFKSLFLPELKVGDTIAVLNSGAYISSMASNYNLLRRPSEVLIDGDREIVIKRQETLDDMLATFQDSQ